MRVLVVGAGFGGIAAAIELTTHGYDDVTVLEAGTDLGGTWHWNTYPGAACDVPSHFYSFSFAQRATWSRFCSPQAEILDYLHAVADRFDVAGLVRLDQRVTDCRWDERSGTWTVTARDSAGTTTERTAEVLVVATGQLDQPAYPSIPGRDDFAGHSFHTARWDHDYDLTGRRVAVIGTGATAVQLVPAVAEVAAHTSVFQRSGSWLLPRQVKDYSSLVATLFRVVPGLNRAFRAVLAVYLEFLTASIRHPRTVGRVLALWSTLFMRGQLKDPDVRAKAWPDYTFGCKRVLFSSAYLPALQRPDVTLVTDPIVEMTPRGPRTSEGIHEVDCLIYATGFRTTNFVLPTEVVGREGRRLADDWSDGPRAHTGITIPGYPNLFLLYGPNTNTSGGSIVFFLEHQARYVRQALDLLRREGAAAMEVRSEVARASDRALQARFAGTAWTACDSWYRDEGGRIVTNWPGYMREYAEATRQVRAEDFQLSRTLP